MKLNEVKSQPIKENFKPGDRVRFTSPTNRSEDGVVVRTLDHTATEVKFDSGEKRGVFTTSLKLIKESKDIRLLEQQLALIEKKKMSAKDDPCWSGYHMVGTKTKNGREVPNCVPGKKGVAEATKEQETEFHKKLDTLVHDTFGRRKEEMKESDYDKSHGSPYDRGAADSYYGRPRRPHKGGVGGGSGERIEDLTPEEIKAYHTGYDDNERHGDKKIWDSKDNNAQVSEADEPGDVRTKFALQKARSQFPMAKSDAEALALYINRKEQKDVDELEAENDYEDMMIDQLSNFDDKINKEVDELQRQINQLKKHAGLKTESVVEGTAEDMIKHVKDARAFMNSAQPKQEPNRAGYNPINSKEEWLEKVRVMHQVQNDPNLKDDAEAQEAIRQRIGDLNRVGIEKGWA